MLTVLAVSIAYAHTYENSIAITIENPTNSEDITLWQVENGITITEVVCVQRDGTSITIDPRHGSDRSAAGTPVFATPVTVTDDISGNTFNVFSDPVLSPDEFLWLESTTTVDDPIEVSCTFYYQQY